AIKYYSILSLDEDLINIWNSLGLVKLALGRIDSARSYFNEAMKASQKLGYSYGTKKSNHNLGLLNLKTGDLATARAYFNTSLSIDIKAKDAYGIALNRNQLARLSIEEGDYDEAVDLLNLALKSAGSISAAHLQIE